MTFRIEALPPEPFTPLFAITDAELAARRTRRMVVDAHPGTPCRVSLADAQVGETVILTHYTHQPADTPYRASHAIFVRAGAARARPAVGEVPDVLRSRLVSLRMFDAGDMMIAADVVPGTELAAALNDAFAGAAAAYAHLHYAKPGCFAASARRA